jgi:hypothetical protein
VKPLGFGRAAPGKNDWMIELVPEGTGARSLLGVM